LDAARALALAVSQQDAAQGTPIEVPTTPHDRAAWLIGTRQIVDAVEVAFTRVLADFDAAGDGQVLHAAATTQSWLRGALGMAAMEASERVRIARGIRAELAPALASVLSSHDADAVNDSIGDAGVTVGQVSYDHVRSSSHSARVATV
jgi:hypothetical protein